MSGLFGSVFFRRSRREHSNERAVSTEREHDTSSLLPTPTESLRSPLNSGRFLTRSRSFNPRSFAVRKNTRGSRTSSNASSNVSSTVSSGRWLDRNTSFSENDDASMHAFETRTVAAPPLRQRQPGSSDPDRPARRYASQPARPAQRRTAGSPHSQQQQQRSRSMPPSNPFSPNGSRVPQPQPRFRPAGPGPKGIRNPWARTITFRPVHDTLGYDARRAARWVESPPWRALPYYSYRHGHHLEDGNVERNVDSDTEPSICCCSWLS